jgi:hypothetical protein
MSEASEEICMVPGCGRPARTVIEMGRSRWALCSMSFHKKDIDRAMKTAARK